MRRAAVATAILVSFTSACTSSYLPAPGPRLSVTMEGGQPVYTHDGQKYNGGFLGGDIEEAVRGSPKAEEYAHDYKTGTVAGFVMVLLGTVGVCGGAVLAGDEAGQSKNATPGVATFGAGLALYAVGLGVLLAAQPHLWDAINAYNDDFDHPPDATKPTHERAPPAPAPSSSGDGSSSVPF
jgi:hypothetical protein